jgi:acyl-CoA synthetase (NDP forming)
LTQAGVPCFRTPEACGDAIAAAFSRRVPKEPGQPGLGGAERQLDEAQGYALLQGLGVPVAPHVVMASASAAPEMTYPVALKLLSADVLHKSDLGGVALGITDAPALTTARDSMVATLAQTMPELVVDRVLVQEMVAGVGEVLLSVRRDPDAGLMVMLAAGGILAEIHKDRSIRLAPVDLAEAEAMIGEVKALKALAGYRGRPRGDLAALADAIVAISKAGPDVIEVEVNPLIVRAEGSGVVAVDAVARVFTGENA